MQYERVAGGLVGVAVGDALGVPVEGRSRAHLKADPVTDMRGYGTYHQPPGTWSDDSSLTFCTAESLTGGFDLEDIGRRFVEWLQRCYWSARGEVFDIGGTTHRAITALRRGTPAEKAGPASEWDNGNGSLMRILPVALRFAHEDLPTLVERAHRVSRITHGHPRAQVACGIYVAVARRLLRGEGPGEAYAAGAREALEYYEAAPAPLRDELDHFRRVLAGDIGGLPEEAIESSGYVVHTLEAALWCLLNAADYRETVLKAVNLGHDTDTTAAVAGGLAGVAYGLEAIPARWRSQVARYEDIVDLARRLARAAGLEGA